MLLVRELLLLPELVLDQRTFVWLVDVDVEGRKKTVVLMRQHAAGLLGHTADHWPVTEQGLPVWPVVEKRP